MVNKTKFKKYFHHLLRGFTQEWNIHKMIYYEIIIISVWYFPSKYLKTFFLIIKTLLNEKIFFKSSFTLFMSSLFDRIMNKLKESYYYAN